MIIVSLNFSRKNGSKRSLFFAKKLCNYHDNRYTVFHEKINLGDNHKAIIAISRFNLGPFCGPM
jgi:hypothetical protein